MKSVAYPVIFEKTEDGYFVTVPDLDRNTQGDDLADAIMMARDLISLCIVDLEDDGKPVPAPNSVPFKLPEEAVLSFVDVNVAEYRKKYGTKIVKKNCSIPAWINTRAEELQINFSQTLQEALLRRIQAASE